MKKKRHLVKLANFMRWPVFLGVVLLGIFLVWKIQTPEKMVLTSKAPVEDENVFDPEISEQNLVAQNSIFESNSSFSSSDFREHAPVFQQVNKSPMLAATLGCVPGLGHVYLNDLKTASALASSAGVGVGLYFGSNDKVHSSGVIGLQTTGFYSVYSAYRDARIQNGMYGYSYRMPTENLADLAYAPFQWSVIKKPEVWGGIVATLGLAVGAIYMARNAEPASVERFDMPYLSLPMSIGEEAFFRGFLQSALAEPCTPWGGIALSSLAFGAAHIRNAFDLPREDRAGYFAFGIPLITGLGVYYGWMTYKNHSLKESVAAHTWYNFIVMMTTAWIAHRATIGKTGFAIAVPF